ncbi:hypothetical protein L916_19299 [Phytophthora nicotianae]|uniref:Uncharacterized protein n=1 Tax=Phytophthora nicotianae TaxID=4792 RepID=W2I197_PHYNI|nr:hypothetical protein L916_19299 [Phytophthora nicotianae]
MKSIKDLLVWYNNLDVKPFVQAIKAQRELFKKFDLDMFYDDVSLPAKRYLGYTEQDKKAGREFGLSMEH